jgi:predicted nucleic acid-binding Zn ribbon protein
MEVMASFRVLAERYESVLEVMDSISDALLQTCPECKRKVEKKQQFMYCAGQSDACIST